MNAIFALLLLWFGLFIPLYMIMIYNPKQRFRKLKDENLRIRDNIIHIESELRSASGELSRKELVDDFFVLMKKAYDVAERLRQVKNVPEAVAVAESLESFVSLSKININTILPKTNVSEGDEIKKLALLRSEGMISDHEFQAFSERFTVTTGEKAKSVIGAISDLYDQHRRGVMSEGNYHAALWTLMDKLDRKT